MLMTPGLALFYGGMVQGKNVLSTFMHSFFALGLVSVQFAVIGYSLAFGPTHGGLIGGFDYVGARRHRPTSMHGTVPHARVRRVPVHVRGDHAGADLGRVRGAHEVFGVRRCSRSQWTTLVYDPIAHWAWADGGWLTKLGAIDFAGGTVVHLSSGISALVVAHRARQAPRLSDVAPSAARSDDDRARRGPAVVRLVRLQRGPAPGANGTAALALLNTHLAAAAGALTWALVEGARIRKSTMLGVASGLVAGLVAITPAAGYVSPMVAIVDRCRCGRRLLRRGAREEQARLRRRTRCVRRARCRRRDRRAAHRRVRAGALNNGARRRFVVARQAGDRVGAAAAWAALVTFVLLKLIDLAVGLRVDAETEHDGLDGALHGESAYATPGTTAHWPEADM